MWEFDGGLICQWGVLLFAIQDHGKFAVAAMLTVNADVHVVA